MALYLVPVDQGRPIVLDKAVVFIGRHPECDVVLKHSRKVSRKHCCIAQVDSRIVVRDLGSMNGVRLNGERVTHEATVRLGDQVTIGDVGYVLQTHDALGRSRPPQPQPPNGRRPAPPSPPAAPPRSAPPERSVPGADRTRRNRPAVTPPLALSQDMPVPIPEEDGDFRVEESRYRSDPDPRPGTGSDDIVVLSDSDEVP